MLSEKQLAGLKLGPLASRTHGQSSGKSRTRSYGSWASMIQRIYNPKNDRYKDYGGRGISISDSWRVFINFYDDMGDRPKGKSLDRIDVDGHYTKENCKWSTAKEQSNNMRCNVYIEYKGQLKTVNVWADEIGMKACTLYTRIKRGWTTTRAMETPVNVKRKVKRGKQ